MILTKLSSLEQPHEAGASVILIVPLIKLNLRPWKVQKTQRQQSAEGGTQIHQICPTLDPELITTK